jgi:hypothetical protein
MIRFTVERMVRGTPDEVYAWFSDYSDRDYTGPNWSPKEGMRRTVSEQDAQHATFTDFYSRTALRYRAEKRSPLGVEAVGVGDNMNGRVILKVSSAPEGSKLTIDFQFEPRGIARLFAGVMGGQIERATAHHVDCFIQDFHGSRAGGP